MEMLLDEMVTVMLEALEEYCLRHPPESERRKIAEVLIAAGLKRIVDNEAESDYAL